MNLSPALVGIASTVADGVIPGAVVLIAGTERVHAHEAIGATAIDGAPMRPDSLFRIASMTKPVVSVAALQLIEAGRLQLDDPVARYLPELAALSVLRSSDPGVIEPARRPVTIFDLLTHTAGFAYPGSVEGLPALLLGEFNTEFLPGLPEGEWLVRLGEVPLAHQPGEAFTYGFSTDVLGLALSRIESRPLGDVLQRQLFEQLGMEETGFEVRQADRARLVRAYSREADAKLTEIPPELDSQSGSVSSFQSGGAGLVSTAEDYLRFARFLLGGQGLDGRTLLSPRLVALMTSNHLTEAHRQRPCFGIDDYWAEQGFGLGVSVLDRPGAARSKSVGRYGWAGAYGTLWLNEPRHGLAALLMAQVRTLEGQPPYELQFEADLHEALP